MITIYVCTAVMFICGMILLIKPNLGTTEENVKPGITLRQNAKRNRIGGIIIMVLSIIIAIINLL